VVWLTAFMGAIATLYYFDIITTGIPWITVSVIGTAVAFYAGFKNNQAYDRMWEARKIWGGVVNDSRTWGMMVDAYVSNLFNKNKASESEIYAVKKRLIYPRQYANLSRYFVDKFIILLPFSMIPEIMKMGDWGVWISIPITALVGWVYVMMELVGDYTENPFQGMANDIPMMSLCQVIEIDLREMLGETDLPPSIKAKNGLLM